MLAKMTIEDQVRNPPTKTIAIVHGMVVNKDRSGTVKIPAKKPKIDKATLLKIHIHQYCDRRKL